MRWRGERQSGNIEDRRGFAPGGLMLGGGGAVLLAIVAMLFGVDPRAIFEQVQSQQPNAVTERSAAGSPDSMRDFVSVVLAETEDVWHAQLAPMGVEYREPTLVLFSGAVQSACGMSSAATGPFYCPSDERVYIDLSFYDELRDRFHAPGDFAEAYVIAHEVGHHVQNLLGISERVRRMQERVGEAEANDLSVRLELQADFLAGVWAHHAERTKHNLDPGDVEEALDAAAAIGDDRLQKESQGYVVPDSFTHGTSIQRVRWFRKGYETGDISQGDTFAAQAL